MRKWAIPLVLGLIAVTGTQAYAGHFVLTGSLAGNSAFLEAQRARILRQIGWSGPDTLGPIEVVAAQSTAQFDRIAGPGFPQWGLALAERENSRIAVRPRAAAAELRPVLVHELTHILLHQTDQGAFLPRWFHEGIAMTFAGELSFEENVQVSRAAFAGNLLSLDEIEKVNAFHSSKAALAYAQSHLAILILMKKHGAGVIPEIIAASRKYRDFWKGFHDVLTINRAEWEKLYRDELRKEYAWIFLLGDFWMFWILLALGFVVILVIKKRQNRRKLEEWKHEEEQIALEPDERTL